MASFDIRTFLQKIDNPDSPMLTEGEQKDGDQVRGDEKVTSKQTPGKGPQDHPMDGRLVGETEEPKEEKEDKDESLSNNDPWGIGGSASIYGSNEETNEDDESDNDDEDDKEPEESDDDSEDTKDDETDDAENDKDEVVLGDQLIDQLMDEFGEFLHQKADDGEIDLSGDEEMGLEEEGPEENPGEEALERVTQRSQERGDVFDRIARRGSNGCNDTDDDEMVAINNAMTEAWGTKTNTPKSERGKYKGKTKADLKKQLANLKKTGPHKKGSKEYEKMKELQFAIRAKSNWGKVNEEEIAEYNRPESFDPETIEKGVNRAFGHKTFWQGVKRFLTGEWADPVQANTKYAFKILKDAGLTYDQINELRHMLHRVMGGYFKQKGIKIQPGGAKLPTRVDLKDYKPTVSRYSGNFIGWLVPAEIEVDMEPIYKQVMANLKRKFSESAPSKGEIIKINGEKAKVLAVNEARMVIRTASGNKRLVEFSNLEEGYGYGGRWRDPMYRDFKSKEMRHELGHEDKWAEENENWMVAINGRRWKAFKGKRHALAVARKIRAKNPNKKVDVFSIGTATESATPKKKELDESLGTDMMRLVARVKLDGVDANLNKYLNFIKQHFPGKDPEKVLAYAKRQIGEDSVQPELEPGEEILDELAMKKGKPCVTPEGPGVIVDRMDNNIIVRLDDTQRLRMFPRTDIEIDGKREPMKEGWSTLPPIDRDRYQERQGLEGPFITRSGKVVYYDPKEGQYYDPDSDMYLSFDEYHALDESDEQLDELLLPSDELNKRDGTIIKPNDEDSDVEQIPGAQTGIDPAQAAQSGQEVTKPELDKLAKELQHPKIAKTLSDIVGQEDDQMQTGPQDELSQLKAVLQGIMK